MDAMTHTSHELKKQLNDALQLVSQTVEEIGQNPESLIAPTSALESGRGLRCVASAADEHKSCARGLHHGRPAYQRAACLRDGLREQSRAGAAAT